MAPATTKTTSEKTAPWRVLAVFAIPIIASWVKVTYHHRERVPATGAFILAPNHFTNIDPIVVGYALFRLGRVPRFLAKASLFRIPVVGGFLRGLGQIPVERSGRGANPLAAAAALAERGQSVIIYPEGTLTREPDLWPMRGKSGAVRAALERGVPIIPAAHWGTQQLMGRYSSRFRPFPRKHIDLAFGEPVDLAAWSGRPLSSEELAAATEHVMDAITALLEELRGERAPAERWDPAQHGQTEFGRP
ncbi:lysophospholipid acyltransferase family protein [Homoserinibacter sp. YIM 151385]|uniref:lysophospholipid acyltransferase family protein n=1 Tax=Homoserinibacter sp. YIM 151385 TaxID=2985506 RepID=UPI0022F08C96|nr:lysophospholipid acyltransferase family protein [Homoserinibacter sp. YIM 151385]WBU39223.1 lysophospholipid acyltransferase family protein [Homoserinibacter sp. YIM 151385]